MRARKSELKNIGRLLKRADFLRVQQAGRKWVTPHFIIQIAVTTPELASSPLLFCRYGMTVTKKIFPRAVDRNRVRRRCRALFLTSLFEKRALMANQKYDFVILPRLPALMASVDSLEKELNWALKRLLTNDIGEKERNNV